jgi:enoyl-CoA hydratase
MMKPLHEQSFTTLVLSMPEDDLLLITMNRQQSSNALDTVMTRELLEIWQHLYVSQHYRSVILTGAGDRCFCAGADLKERNGISTELWLTQHAVLEQMMLAMHDCPLPLLAAVNGAAFGGGLELLLNCDFAWCSDNARFAFPESGLGFIPGAMGTQWLPRVIGPGKASELCMTGRSIDAQEALQWGLVNRVLSQKQLLDEMIATARTINSKSPLAIRQVKQALNAAVANDLVSGYRREIELYRRCIEGSDRIEGIKAFAEKRKPEF